jgi:integrase
VRTHDLRHTYASLLLENGANIKRVSEALGHASITITLTTYSHLLPSMDRDIANRIDAILEEAGR